MNVSILTLNFTLSCIFSLSMDFLALQRFCFVCLVILSFASLHGTNAETIVSGTVFCDQCKDGHLSFFDYPLSGMKVIVACPGPDKEEKVIREESTNWLGSYYIKFDGVADLNGCFVRVSGSTRVKQNCIAAAGPPQKLGKVFKLFGYAFYSVDALLSQPQQPMSLCPKSNSTAPSTVKSDPDHISPAAPPLPLV